MIRMILFPGACALALALAGPAGAQTEAEAGYLAVCQARSGGTATAAECMAAMGTLQAEMGPEAFEAHVQELRLRDCAAASDWWEAERNTPGVLRGLAREALLACFSPPAFQLEMAIGQGR